MLLSSSAIRARINDGTLGITPFAEESLQPASYDLRAAEDTVMKTGELSLIATMEFVSLPADLAATLRGRSSFGRKGVLLGAGYIDPGFRGNLTLCMVNMGKEDPRRSGKCLQRELSGQLRSGKIKNINGF